ncbi:tyrosine-protein kinase RYK [Anabrus simplex]|uniref:tyrosine-protein kinase RYK n=1 Tax=Anabrus simplex TaxID=316456 RepID=UPI0035A3B8B0
MTDVNVYGDAVVSSKCQILSRKATDSDKDSIDGSTDLVVACGNLTTAGYIEQLDIQEMEWPAVSPDLNHIDHVWERLDRSVRGRPVPPQTLQEHEQALIEEWALNQQRDLSRLILEHATHGLGVILTDNRSSFDSRGMLVQNHATAIASGCCSKDGCLYLFEGSKAATTVQRNFRSEYGKDAPSLSAELYYVREGVVNTYAMNFIVPVPAHISDLEFSWQSLTKNPLPYVLAIDYDNHAAMKPPQVNISTRGLIPTQVQTFRVRFPCTGLESAEIEVLLQLNVSTYNPLHNETSLNFRRNKICLKEEPTPRNDSIRLNPGSLVTSSGTFYVAVGCACAMIIVVIAVTSIVYVKSKKARTQESLHTTYTSAAYGSNPNVFIRLDSMARAPSVGSGSYATIASFHKVPLSRRSSPSPCPYATTHVTSTNGSGGYSHHIYSKPATNNYSASRVSYYASSQLTHLSQLTLHDPRLLDPADRLRDLATPRHTIFPQTLLQEGTFGRIYRGVWQDENQGRQLEVFIKTVSDQASRFQVSLLLAEGTMLHGFSHKNVLPVIAANVENMKQPLLVYPYSNKGNLKRFLQNCRLRGEEQYTLLTQDIVDMGIQVVLAMMFLHGQRVCHKDVATRNCVVDEKLRVKVTDNALSRDLFPGDYYCLGDNENRPIKWLAIESLLHKQFTGASDVWAFGVLLWELTTLAQQPYAEVDPFEMAAYLRDGYRLAQPINCPDELFALMACCWLAVPEERPTFVQLLACLQEFYTALGRYI